MVTAYPNRTSPVLRGKWVLDSLLGTPPPPPPPNVPSLKDRGENGRPASVRERLEEHRKNPACASCHSQMDPLGFALENFDAIGKWRTTSEGGTPIDASAVLPSGVQFSGPRGLRAVLLGRREQFVDTVTRKAPVVRARPRCRVLRSAGRPQDRPEVGAGRLPLVVDHPGNRAEHAVSDEDVATATSGEAPCVRVARDAARAFGTCSITCILRSVAGGDHIMFISKISLAPTDVPARNGRHAGAAVAGRDGAGALRRAPRPRRVRSVAWAWSMSPTGWRWTAGLRRSPDRLRIDAHSEAAGCRSAIACWSCPV